MLSRGDNVALLYDVVTSVEPVVLDHQLDGYTFNSPLPPGLVELEPPQHRVPMATPVLWIDDGTFIVAIDRLTEIAQTITLIDESTWDDLYDADTLIPDS